MPALGVLLVGELARAALERGSGVASLPPGLQDGPYYMAADELLWVGARLPAMHPRAVVTAAPRPSAAPLLRLGPLPARGWTSGLPVVADAARLAAGAGRLREALVRAEAPRGFGALLAGDEPEFPLSLGVARVRALEAALARDAPQAAGAAARPLLGFGTGLTPSGDDLVGAALFARRMLAPRDERWAALAGDLASEVATRSHLVSAALFGDLARGCSFAPLHEAAHALAADDDSGALGAARALAAIGHSSGWDMLTGLLIGMGIGLPH
jgi:Protein of unknown function (DUF2877)